jgi:magnesium chelatase subunit I
MAIGLLSPYLGPVILCQGNMAIEKPASQLLRLLEEASPARAVLRAPHRDRGLADAVRFPFLAVVGQAEMKIALILALINPHVGGVLLIGPRGTGKTTAVRGLVELLPIIRRSSCALGCTPEAAEAGGMDAICPQCAHKLGRGEPITAPDPMRLIELPLNARLEDVVGGINERLALEQQKIRLERGILSYADQNLLYVDEVNLLDDAIANAILDAAAQGYYTVRRGPLTNTYRARLTLIGSMNPEEGNLRPQIMDRFGLRVVICGLTDTEERLEVARRVQAFAANHYDFATRFTEATLQVADEINKAHSRLSQVTVMPEAEQATLELVGRLRIQSLRAEIVTLQAARARAAADERDTAGVADVAAVAPMALRLRYSPFIANYVESRQEEEATIQEAIEALGLPSETGED